MKTIIVTLMSIAFPALALAHPGHGNEDPLGPYHYIANAEHLIPLVLAIVAGIVLINWVYRWRKKTEKK